MLNSSPATTPASYATVDDAAAYFATRLGTGAWDLASPTDRQKSLYQATRAIDRLMFAGVKTSDYLARLHSLNAIGSSWGYAYLPPGLSATAPQALEFPRNGDAAIPVEILYACCECALALLDGVDPEQELNNLPAQELGFADVRTSFDRSIRSDHYRAGIPSAVAWTYLLPFLQDPNQISLSRA